MHKGLVRVAGHKFEIKKVKEVRICVYDLILIESYIVIPDQCSLRVVEIGIKNSYDILYLWNFCAGVITQRRCTTRIPVTSTFFRNLERDKFFHDPGKTCRS